MIRRSKVFPSLIENIHKKIILTFYLFYFYFFYFKSIDYSNIISIHQLRFNHIVILIAILYEKNNFEYLYLH